jgi:RNA-directed DNA polymerase
VNLGSGTAHAAARVRVCDGPLRMVAALPDRLARFGLSLHAGKTRLVEFGRFAAANRLRRGEGRPETFDFLGFTHFCGVTRKGGFMVQRKTQCEPP